MTKEALTLALEALDQLTNVADTFSVSGVYLNEEMWAKKCLSDAYFAITAIEKALSSPNGEAQPEQEPVAWMGTDIEGNPNKFRLNQFSGSFPLYAQAQPWTDDLALIAYLDGVKDGKKITPPQRTAAEGEDTRRAWVGLTDEERNSLYAAHHNKYDLPNQGSPDGMDYERAIEAKLMEKNT